MKETDNPMNHNEKASMIPSDIFRKGIHGLEHAYRVFNLVQKLAELEELDSQLKSILEFCAIFHDTGRINDEIDNYHGVRSTTKLKENRYFGLESFNEPITSYIIENHCINDNKAFNKVSNYKIENNEEAVYLLTLFKDADNLDRVRLGDFNPDYLRNESSKKLIQFSSDLFFQSQISISTISLEFKRWLDENGIKK